MQIIQQILHLTFTSALNVKIPGNSMLKAHLVLHVDMSVYSKESILAVGHVAAEIYFDIYLMPQIQEMG